MATDGGDTKTESDIWTCGVCLEELWRPRLLPCGHECCMKCLEYWEEGGRSPLLCPTCRKVVYLPPEGIAGLMKPLWVGNCRLMSRTTNDKNASGPRKVTTCYKHQTCGLTWFCDTCDRTICRECVTTEHGRHPVSHITKLVEKKKQEALGLVERGSEKAAALQARLRYLAACRYELERQQAEAEAAIEAAAQTLREEIERQKHSSLHWLNSLCGQEFEKLAGAQTRTEQDFAQLTSALHLVISFGKTVKNSSQNPISLLSAVKALSQAVQGVDVKLSHTIIRVKFVPSKTGVNIGNVAFTTGERFRPKQHHNNFLSDSPVDNNNAVISLESTGSQSLESPMLIDPVYDTPTTPNSPLVPPTPPAHRKVQVGGGYGSETGQFKNPFALAVSSHYLYVADRANGGRVQIFDFCGNLVRSFLLMLGKGLEALTGGIVLMPNGTIKYLGGGHETMICDRAGRAVGRACYPVMTAYNPNGKCISRTKLQIRQGHLVDAVALPNGNIAVVVITGLWERADCILLSERGQKLCEVHSSQTTVGDCVSLSVNPNSGDILLCEPKQEDRDRVTLFNSQGRPKSTTLQLGHIATTTTANDISVDSYGNIISSTKNARLQLYDKKGAFLKDVASGKDGLKRPSKVALTRDRRVAVIDEGAVCVFMFSY
ncbi:tripartite motif-containing protein 2-like [Branchiostoma lanceolatum]|uniref:tripartite motif-containing protein 2-like n=1 Tax=Branchiostoma lanceolatum TaxID=7740 RepID=UPI003456A419